MAALFAGGVLLFLVLRLVLVPKDFGLYGHYRAGALADVATKPVVFGGRAACADCHTEIIDKQKGSKHAAIGCEACHGPLARHVTDPSSQVPTHLVSDTKRCLGCHASNPAKPKGFLQIDPKSHGEGEPCASCHGPHAPEKGAV